MSLLFNKTVDSCRIAVWKMDETPDELRAALAGTSLYEEAERKFLSLQRRKEWLSVRILLRDMLGEHKAVCYHPSGRPYLADNSFHIGISHTKGFVTVMLGNRPVSVDIEQYGQRVHRVADRFVRADEVIADYRAEDTWSLLLHWSAKETLFKYLDASEVDFKEHFRIFPFALQEQGTFQAQEYRTQCCRTFLIHYLLHPDFVLTFTC